MTETIWLKNVFEMNFEFSGLILSQRSTATGQSRGFDLTFTELTSHPFLFTKDPNRDNNETQYTNNYTHNYTSHKHDKNKDRNNTTYRGCTYSCLNTQTQDLKRKFYENVFIDRCFKGLADLAPLAASVAPFEPLGDLPDVFTVNRNSNR